MWDSPRSIGLLKKYSIIRKRELWHATYVLIIPTQFVAAGARSSDSLLPILEMLFLNIRRLDLTAKKWVRQCYTSPISSSLFEQIKSSFQLRLLYQ